MFEDAAARHPPFSARAGGDPALRVARRLGLFLLALLAALPSAAAPTPAAAPSPSAAASPAPGRDPVIIFLVDNSASLPPLDPEEKRVTALQRMFQVLQGHPYRLILFG